MTRTWLWIGLTLVIVGCGEAHLADAGADDADVPAPRSDGGVVDGGPPADAGTLDGGQADAGEASDGGLTSDGGPGDAGESDGGPADGGLSDGGSSDGGSSDGGLSDGGSSDGGAVCELGFGFCGGACVDLLTDRSHCGDCGAGCAETESCVAGSCRVVAGGDNATGFDCDAAGVVGRRFEVRCTDGGDGGRVWGTDTYTHDSSICAAAVHAGRAHPDTGGTVIVEMRAGRAMYRGTDRNSVSTRSFAEWGCSFGLVGGGCEAGLTLECGDFCGDPLSETTCGACEAVCTGAEVCGAGGCECPAGGEVCDGACTDTDTDVAHCGDCETACGTGERCEAGACSAFAADWSTNAVGLACAASDSVVRAYECPADGTASSVWGTDLYTADSPVCVAAVHAGAITLAGGGRFALRTEPGAASYTGSTRNGVTTHDFGGYACSYRFLD